MENKVVLQGRLVSSKNLQGQASSQVNLAGRIAMGGTKMSDKDVVKYIEQNPTFEESAIARKNIRAVGESSEGKICTPYMVDEPNDYVYIYDEPIEAQEGAEIYNDYENNIATGAWSKASGFKTQALGNYSIADGWWTRADGQCAVASGLLSIASGHFSHAEGTRTQATINNAHSEGDMTVASGRQSHSEGQKTTASGFCSHSEGSGTVSSGYYSHAEGLGTIAAGKNQTAMGKYNIKDTTSLVIVGNGTKDSNRKNAYKLSSKGEGWFAGSVECTEVILSSPNGSRFTISVDDNGNISATKI